MTVPVPVDTARMMVFACGLRIKFKYTNWKAEYHEYVIDVESFDYGPPPGHGRATVPSGLKVWVMNGQVVTRDGDPREEMGPNRRRTFFLNGIHEIEVLEGRN